ncbi:unnamed protein product [Arabis nemorensis]|uniref:Uncharacterized protein n=1 Tax=Arabis nemorensis TaxID=586526 RepID=A0A565CIV5_9BRAS|nr:unnamed protein product [Arabis nemorensis]
MLRPKRGIQPQILEDEDFRVFLMFGPNVDDEGMIMGKLKSVFIRVHSSGTSQGLIFLVDGHDDTISNAKSELRNILQQSSGKKNPLLILAIKKNLVDGLSDKDIADKLELPSLEGIKWQVQSVCTLEDEGFTKGISWLRPSIKEHEIDPTCPKERPEGKSERCKKIEEVAQENPNSP